MILQGRLKVDKELPLVSIVTPSYNKGPFIEETILSIKNQTYPHIEHIVVDGGSTDETLDILHKYGDSLVWISEPDEGQSDAINKGWRMAKGEVLAYLNADDTYMPWAVETAVEFLNEHPDVCMVYGNCDVVGEHGEVIQCMGKDLDLKELICGREMIPQPAVFLRRMVLDEVGYLDTCLHLAMDYDLWIRIGSMCRMKHTPKLLAKFRMGPGTKSVDDWYKFAHERLYILERLFSNPGLPKELKALERQAYSAVHLNIGFDYYSRGDVEKARKHFVKALRLHPLTLKNRWLVVCLATSLLGGKMTSKLAKWKHKLAHNLSF